MFDHGHGECECQARESQDVPGHRWVRGGQRGRETHRYRRRSGPGSAYGGERQRNQEYQPELPDAHVEER